MRFESICRVAALVYAYKSDYRRSNAQRHIAGMSLILMVLATRFKPMTLHPKLQVLLMVHAVTELCGFYSYKFIYSDFGPASKIVRIFMKGFGRDAGI